MFAVDWSSDVIAVVAVLGLAGGFVAFLGRAFVRWLNGKLAAIDKKATPNGGNTLDLGDTAARTEEKVDEMRDMFIYHLLHHPGGPMPLPENVTNGNLTKTRADVVADNTDDAAGQHQYTPPTP